MARSLSDPRRTVEEVRSSRNLELIPVHQGLASAYVWMPVLVLFTRSRFGLGQALVLAALYYLSVVVLEVPSGWMSDRLGRVITLRAAAASWVVAQACFLVGGITATGDAGFWMLVAGQFFLAGGFASLSGTDVTFHYDTLEAVDRAGEYPERQSRVSAVGFGVSAGERRRRWCRRLRLPACGLPAGPRAGARPARGHLRPHGASGRRPPIGRPTGDEAASRRQGEAAFTRQLRACVGYLASPFLAWIFAYGVLMVTLEHVAESVLQPWLTELTGTTATDLGATPLLSGLVFAAVALVGAGAARSSAPLARRFGTITTLLGLAVLSAVIVTVMARWAAPAVLVLVAFRNAQGAAAPVLISDAVASRVERGHRATLLSLNSLAGRLGLGLDPVGGRRSDRVRRRRCGRSHAGDPGRHLLGDGRARSGVGGRPRTGPLGDRPAHTGRELITAKRPLVDRGQRPLVDTDDPHAHGLEHGLGSGPGRRASGRSRPDGSSPSSG